MNDLFGAFGKLWKRGRILWGWVVMANHQLYEKGEDDCPGEILYSLTQDDIVAVSRMPELADRLWSLKTAAIPNHAWSQPEQEIAADLASEMAWHAGFRLPETWGGTAHEFRLNTIMFHREHLPERRITHRLLPVLLLPDLPFHSIVVPETYWTEELHSFLNSYTPDRAAVAAAKAGQNRVELEAAYQEILGPIGSVLHETESRHAHVDVYVISPRAEREFWTFITSGMSDNDQPANNRECSDRVELVLYTKSKFPQVSNALRNFAHYPFESGQGLANGDTIPLGQHGEAVLGSDRFPVLLFVEAVRPCDRELVGKVLIEGKPLHPLMIIPLTESEFSFYQSNGLQSFFEAVRQSPHSIIFDPDRPSII